MNPAKVDRNRLLTLTDLPNIGAAMAEDFRVLGIDEPGQLADKNPFQLFEQLCAITASRHDPCVLDVFISVTRFMNGDEPRPWWAYTEERKRFLAKKSKSKP